MGSMVQTFDDLYRSAWGLPDRLANGQTEAGYPGDSKVR